MLFPIRHDRNAVQITKKVLPLNKYAGGLPMSRVTSPFGIFLNFNFPKNEVIYRKVVLYMDNRVNNETQTNAS